MGLSEMAVHHLMPESNHVALRSRENSPFRSPSPRRASPVVMDERPESYNIPSPLENIGCQDLLQEDKCSYCGWLRKRRTIKLFQWPQAYVVLHDGCFYYFKNEKMKSAAGKFSLYGYNSVYRASEIQPKEAPWSFKIVHSHEEFKTYYFSASSEQEMKKWMTQVKEEMLKANGRSIIYGNINVKQTAKKDSEDMFYNDVETNIYDDASKFIPTKDYPKQFSVKRENEVESDDEDLILINNPAMDSRPPVPIPFNTEPALCFDTKAPNQFAPPIPTSLPPPKAPRVPTNSEPTPKVNDNHPVSRTEKIENHRPMTPPRTHRRQSPPDVTDSDVTMETKSASNNKFKPKANNNPMSGVMNQLNKAFGKEMSMSPKPMRRRPSYEKTDELPVPLSPITPTAGTVDYRCTSLTATGGGSTGEEELDTEEYWASVYLDDHDKSRAHDIIQGIGEDGVYLVRPENTGPGKVLVVYAVDQTKKYRIQSQDGKFYLAREGFKDEILENLLCYYYEEDLPTVKSRLKTPYRLHKKFKSLNL